MNEQQQPQDSLTSEAIAQLLQQLRHREGNWLDWGRAAQQLRGVGYDAKALMEETGWVPLDQNQLIVAVQVYDTLVESGMPQEKRSQLLRREGSEIIYELRVLSKEARLKTAELIVEKQLDIARTREVVKAVQDYSRSSQVPEEFTATVGDAVAYRYWKLAREKKDLQARSRLIAEGLSYARSDSARKQVESLLLDFTVVPSRPAPMLPLFRMESEEELPVLVPVLASLKASVDEMAACPQVEATEPFGVVEVKSPGSWVALPGWQGLLNAESPVAIVATGEDIPSSKVPAQEAVLMVVDRAQTEWQATSYFLISGEAGLEIVWFEAPPNVELLGRLIVVLRPKKVIDEEAIAISWDVNE